MTHRQFKRLTRRKDRAVIELDKARVELDKARARVGVLEDSLVKWKIVATIFGGGWLVALIVLAYVMHKIGGGYAGS